MFVALSQVHFKIVSLLVGLACLACQHHPESRARSKHEKMPGPTASLQDGGRFRNAPYLGRRWAVPGAVKLRVGRPVILEGIAATRNSRPMLLSKATGQALAVELNQWPAVCEGKRVWVTGLARHRPDRQAPRGRRLAFELRLVELPQKNRQSPPRRSWTVVSGVASPSRTRVQLPRGDAPLLLCLHDVLDLTEAFAAFWARPGTQARLPRDLSPALCAPSSGWIDADGVLRLGGWLVQSSGEDRLELVCTLSLRPLRLSLVVELDGEPGNWRFGRPSLERTWRR